MNEKDIKKLGRTDLLELLIAQSEENERLKNRLAQVEKELSERKFIFEECGSIAEASGIGMLSPMGSVVADKF